MGAVLCVVQAPSVPAKPDSARPRVVALVVLQRNALAVEIEVHLLCPPLPLPVSRCRTDAAEDVRGRCVLCGLRPPVCAAAFRH